jgi:hypothetical protein
MSWTRRAALVCALALASGCGSKSHERHAPERVTPAPAPPTPDTTPIEALRTPAGLALRLDASTTPTSGLVTTPTASASK